MRSASKLHKRDIIDFDILSDYVYFNLKTFILK